MAVEDHDRAPDRVVARTSPTAGTLQPGVPRTIHRDDAEGPRRLPSPLQYQVPAIGPKHERQNARRGLRFDASLIQNSHQQCQNRNY